MKKSISPKKREFSIFLIMQKQQKNGKWSNFKHLHMLQFFKKSKNKTTIFTKFEKIATFQSVAKKRVLVLHVWNMYVLCLAFQDLSIRGSFMLFVLIFYSTERVLVQNMWYRWVVCSISQDLYICGSFILFGLMSHFLYWFKNW